MNYEVGILAGLAVAVVIILIQIFFELNKSSKSKKSQDWEYTNTRAQIADGNYYDVYKPPHYSYYKKDHIWVQLDKSNDYVRVHKSLITDTIIKTK